MFQFSSFSRILQPERHTFSFQLVKSCARTLESALKAPACHVAVTIGVSMAGVLVCMLYFAVQS